RRAQHERGDWIIWPAAAQNRGDVLTPFDLGRSLGDDRTHEADNASGMAVAAANEVFRDERACPHGATIAPFRGPRPSRARYFAEPPHNEGGEDVVELGLDLLRGGEFAQAGVRLEHGGGQPPGMGSHPVGLDAITEPSPRPAGTASSRGDTGDKRAGARIRSRGIVWGLDPRVLIFWT